MRSECDPLFVGNALAGIKAESIPIADRLMLTPYSFDMPTCSGHQESHEPVIFTNPFSENRDVVPTSGVAQQDFEIGDALVYPSSPLELDFGQWVDYDDEE